MLVSPAVSVVLTLTSAMATAVYFVLMTKLMRALPYLSSNFFLCMTNYTGAFILFPVWVILYQKGNVILPDIYGWLDFFLASFFLLLSRELYFYAYSRIDIAQITVFSALTPLYTLLTGYLFLQEIPSLRIVLGILLVTVSIYSIFLPSGYSARKSLSLSMQPFRRIASSPPILCGFLSTIPTAFGAVYQKKTLFVMDIVSFAFFLFVVTGTLSLLIELAKKDNSAMRSNMVAIKYPSFWCIGLLVVLMHISFAPLLLAYHSAVALTLQRCSILFQIVLAYFFLNQRQDIRKRIFASIIILMGLVLIWNQY